MSQKWAANLVRTLVRVVPVAAGLLALMVLPVLVSPVSVAASGPAVEWAYTYGGSLQDYGHSVCRTSDGGYVVAGESRSFGSGDYDAYLLKTDSSGGLVWQRTYGAADDEWLVSADVAQDGGLILGGWTTGGLWLIKTDPDGNKLWEQTYGGDSCIGARACSDGGYIIAGILDQDLYLLKAYANGSVEWSKTIQTDGSVYPKSIEQAQDGGFVVVGYSSNQQIYLAKTYSNGDLQWQYLYAYGTNEMNNGTCVKQTDDGGYVVGGYTGAFGSFDMCLIKTDVNGQPLWGATFGDTGNDHAFSVALTADGGYAIAGITSIDGVWQACVVKTDAGGNLSWHTAFGGSGRNILCESIQETLDGGYVVAGVDQTKPGDDDVWLAKISNPSPNGAPDQPRNASPADGATGVSPTPTIQSTAFSDPDADDTHAASQWQITTTAGDYSSPVLDSGVDAAHLTALDVSSLSYATTYFWHVRHQDNHGAWSDWSSETSFTVRSTGPAAPVLVSPANGAVTSDHTPYLDWSKVTASSTVHYQLQVDNDADFSSPVVNKTSVSYSYYTVTTTLAHGTYYWRVRAVDAAGAVSPWTSAWQFTVGTAPISVPTLASPANGAVTSDHTPYLDWSKVTASTTVHYQLQVDNDADFSSPVVNKTSVSYSYYTVTTTLAHGTYYWRVRAVDAAGNTSPWTSAWQFTVGTAPVSVPTLVSPANGAVTSDHTPYLDWSKVTASSTVHYQLQVDNNADFSSPVVNKTSVSYSYYTVTTTLAHGTYYWRVRAVDAAGNMSPWTSAWSFTVA